MLALPSFGGFLHNTNRGFPTSVKNSTRWFDRDPGYWFIRMLKLLGLATEVRVPTTRVWSECRSGLEGPKQA